MAVTEQLRVKRAIGKCRIHFGWNRLIPIAIVSGLALPSGYAGLLVATNNFHEVVPSELYRSAQPDAAEIAEYKVRYGVKTIINLRGASPRERWYQDELAASESAGIAHIDFGMSARKLQSKEKIARLIEIMDSAAKPILIHCQSGADRTGLASALYLAAIEKQDESLAAAQLSIRYGHFAIPVLSQAYPMDQSFETVKEMLGFTVPASEKPPNEPS